jgi:hypothetical protein
MVVILTILLAYTCNKSPKSIITPGKTSVVYLDDSTKFYEQEIAIVQTKREVRKLQDSLERAVSRKAGTNPTTIIRIKEDTNMDSLYVAFTGSLRDSLEKYKNMSKDSFDKQDLMPYVYEDKWLRQKGRIQGGGISIDSLTVTSRHHLLITEEKGLFKNGKVTLQVINENPKVTYSDIQTYSYAPKKKKFGLVVGPTAVFTGRTVDFGVGLTLGLKLY